MAASGSARKRLALSRPAPRKTSSLLVPSNRHLEKNRVLSRSDNMMTDGSGIEAAPDGSTAAPSITVNPLKRASGKKIESGAPSTLLGESNLKLLGSSDCIGSKRRLKRSRRTAHSLLMLYLRASKFGPRLHHSRQPKGHPF